ncbi:MAG: PAS domain-containing sensor histidine kinase [Melioribacteraceae bacterium]|nr:PAS domain-containing sensor histidine kinase [Melioribacteraceae bacterium]
MDYMDKASLRAKAEERIKFIESIPENMNQEQLLKLAQELQVYKIELEIQNEELLKAQGRINNSFERFYSLFHNAPVGYLICNKVGIITKANATFYHMTNFEDDVVGKAVVDFLVEEDRELFLSRYKAFFKSPSNKQIEVRIKTRLNTHLFCRLEGKLFNIKIDDEEGNLELLISFSDITETKRTHKTLSESENKFRRYVENVSVGVLVSDQNGKHIDSNPFIENMLGYSKSELYTTSISDIVDEVMIREAENHFHELVAKGFAKGEFLIKKKNGEKFWAIVTASKISEEKFLAIFQDITELKNYKEHLHELVNSRTQQLDLANKSLLNEVKLKQLAEQKLIESLAKEKELNQLKSRFISTASHEFRTPLTAILSSTELIQRHIKNHSDEKINLHLSRIQDSVDRLILLMDEVITLNRADSGKQQLNFAEIDFKYYCKDLVEQVMENNLSHIIRHVYICEKDKYNLDKKQLDLILQNLFSNAVKYSPKGGVIEFIVKSNDREIEIRIKDSGIGIPENDLLKVFETFYRASNVEAISGSGLGLSIVKNAVDLHKGRIEIESKVGVGTTFIVFIPVISC